MKFILSFLIILGLAAGLQALAGCHDRQGGGNDHSDEAKTGTSGAEKEAGHAHGHGENAYGGTLLIVGDHIAHLEWVHDEAAGTAKIFLTDHDGSPVLVEEAPKINLVSAAGNKQILTKPVDSKDGTAWRFDAKDEALMAHGPTGRIALNIRGKPYSVALTHDHDHDHEHERDGDSSP
jgi:hypothetical protein